MGRFGCFVLPSTHASVIPQGGLGWRLETPPNPGDEEFDLSALDGLVDSIE